MLYFLLFFHFVFQLLINSFQKGNIHRKQMHREIGKYETGNTANREFKLTFLSLYLKLNEIAILQVIFKCMFSRKHASLIRIY